jgi:hypothetical protein
MYNRIVIVACQMLKLKERLVFNNNEKSLDRTLIILFDLSFQKSREINL